jgi:hypothetical protein
MWVLVAASVAVGCLDLTKLKPAFAQTKKAQAVFYRPDPLTVEETLDREDGVQAQRIVVGCEALDITLSWRRLMGAPPPDLHALIRRAQKEITRTPFHKDDRSRPLFESALRAGLAAVPKTTPMNAPVRLPCGEKNACTIAIGGKPGGGFSIFMHHDHAD